MKQKLNFTKQPDGTWQASFPTSGTLTLVQVSRNEDSPLYLKVTTDNGANYAVLNPPEKYKDQIFQIKIAEGATVTVVSHSVVKAAYYIVSSLDYYTKAEVDELIVGIHQFEPVVASSLPTASADTMYKFYFIPKQSAGEQTNTKDEWMTVKEGSTYSWEKIGETDVDLSDYVTETDLETTLEDYVQKETGKGLSTNDYTKAERTKLAEITDEKLLPAVTSSDNGKTLIVDNGTWQKGEPRDNRIPAITPAVGGSNSDDWTKIMAVNQAGNGFELVYPEEVTVWQLYHDGGGEVQINFEKKSKSTCIFTNKEEDFSLNIRFDTTANCYLFIKNRANHKIHFTVNRIQYGSFIDVPLKKVTEGVLENGVDIEAGGFCLIRAKMVVDMAIIDVMNQPVANPNFTHTANTTVSDPTATITFQAYRRCTQMITISADLGVTLEVNNLSDNYLWIKNNSNSDVDITVTAVTHGGNSVSNIYTPADGIIVPANGVCEMGILVNTDGAFISSRNDLTLQQ